MALPGFYPEAMVQHLEEYDMASISQVFVEVSILRECYTLHFGAHKRVILFQIYQKTGDASFGLRRTCLEV